MHEKIMRMCQNWPLNKYNMHFYLCFNISSIELYSAVKMNAIEIYGMNAQLA